MEVMQIKKIINDNELAKDKSFMFFEEVKEHGLFCKEIMVSSTISKRNDIVFYYENVLLKNTDIRIRGDEIVVEVEDKFSFFISDKATNYRYITDDTEDGTILNILYTLEEKIKIFISILF